MNSVLSFNYSNFLKMSFQVLACAPSNIAVDNLVERLVNLKQKVVRLGHPSRLLPHLQKYCLDAILTSSNAGKLVIDVKKDMDKACVSVALNSYIYCFC